MKLTEQEILNASILIVDDQEPNIILLEQLLREAGYKSLQATTDPTQVCDLHRENNFDLILLDLKMPVMDGFEVMEALKDIFLDSYIPVVVLTAQLSHKIRALQAGAKDFIGKPFDLLEVKTRIHNMLEVRLLYKKLENYNKILEDTVLQRTAELRQSEASYRSLTELASDWYWEQDENGHFIKVSGPVMEMLDFQRDDEDKEAINGVPKLSGWNEDERRKLKDIIAARQPFIDYSFSRTIQDGSVQHYRVSGEPRFDQASRFIGYRGIGIQYKESQTAK